ncbi:hypothetical protein, partial [Rhizobium leguminosarum]|uniref:hypothetical protein n=1 Tax=Rhizobium leguminosarum TaxID=384 RepID=UPI003F9D9B1F
LVSDVFSPATEALVALSQVVRLARLELVAKIMRRTKQIAQENGTELVGGFCVYFNRNVIDINFRAQVLTLSASYLLIVY